jgi:hypothetical protein
VSGTRTAAQEQEAAAVRSAGARAFGASTVLFTEDRIRAQTKKQKRQKAVEN